MVCKAKPWERYQPHENFSAHDVIDLSNPLDIYPTHFSPSSTLIFSAVFDQKKMVVIPQEELNNLKNMIFYIQQYSAAAIQCLTAHTNA
ncbi:hypothetical protein KCM76_18340 [Zooshikella marina]|uniref:hypothetical protein n=1 Tax=Zooshikella ganghwensis TaxID=202772 RepID=UPI001BAE8F0D|nr:hypothetical protein [Zooshikella ganghwensis]MBU2707961.1 hypothetical protein [Zooshikella ganghwensis]